MIEGKQRVRTGCLTCRRRRRKCDEKKPSCENCQAKGLACSYGTKLNFVAQPISGRRQPEERPPGNVPYRQITFVNDVPAAAAGNENFSVEEAQDNLSDEPMSQDSSTTQAQTLQHESTIISTPRDRTRSLNITSPQNQHGYDQTMAASPSESKVITGSLGKQADSPRNERHYVVSPHSGQSVDLRVRARNIQETELLRYYRYHLAAWLDVGSAESFFELKIMLLGSSNRSLLAALLAFSAYQRSLTQAEQQRDDLEISRSYRSEAEYRLPFEDWSVNRIVKVLLMLGDFWSSSPQYWRSFLSQETKILVHHSSLSMTEELDQPVFWLLLRIDLAASICSCQLPLTPNLSVVLENHLLAKSFQFPLLQRQNAIQAYQQSLFLLARCLCLIYGDREGPYMNQTHRTPSTSHLNTSLSLSASWLSIWNDNQECSLALLSNAVYHITSLLLLQKRPWLPEELAGSRQSKSSNWHAHSIAGIATGAERLDQWDPILIAGVLLVAKGMTHEMQQNAMLECLMKVTSLTGIQLHHEIAVLKSEWSISRYVENAVYQHD
ncbi:uncharacterized protein RSE6_06891 [Rhynchosporium secalis]|uniref:Zn(2)-C6 fungal-type domain-containing protein n=1 Tax=Rhynchosporium secalis TaxID=38038 RepID=A0A1E1MBN8_RHYSE|nr:uncharacterized protein RSE6_06891 [Rhynchosporium secalis]